MGGKRVRRPAEPDSKPETVLGAVRREGAESRAAYGTRYPRVKPEAPSLVNTHTADSFSGYPAEYHGHHTRDSAGSAGSCSQCGLKKRTAEDIFRTSTPATGSDPARSRSVPRPSDLTTRLTLGQ